MPSPGLGPADAEADATADSVAVSVAETASDSEPPELEVAADEDEVVGVGEEDDAASAMLGGLEAVAPGPRRKGRGAR